MIGAYEIVMLALLLFPWSLLFVMGVGAAWTKFHRVQHLRPGGGRLVSRGGRP